jgi:hypothetical protein
LTRHDTPATPSVFRDLNVSEIVNDQVNQLGLGSSPAPDGFVTHATLMGILSEGDAGLRGFVSSEVGKVLAILDPSGQTGGVGTRRNLAADPSFRRVRLIVPLMLVVRFVAGQYVSVTFLYPPGRLLMVLLKGFQPLTIPTTIRAMFRLPPL